MARDRWATVRVWAFAFGAMCALESNVAVAQEKVVTPKANILVKGGPGQRNLLLAFEGGVVHAIACAKDGCEPRTGAGLRPPESARKGVERATLDPLVLEGGKAAALVRVPAEAGKSYGMLLAVRDTKAEVPELLWSGFVGGASSTEVVVKRDKKERATLSVERRAVLCGREVVSSKRTLSKDKLALVEQELPDPIGAARATATPLTAAALAEPSAPHRVLRADDWSSGDGRLALDGDAASAWRSEQDQHPFLSLSVSDAIPLTGFELAFDPAAASLPSSLTLLTDAGALAVKLPASAPSGRVAVELARPITSKCVGLVLDRPAAPAGKKPAASSSAFGLAEVAARTSLDAESLEQVAKGLGASGPELKLREALLLAERARGVLAIAKVYAELPPAARERARRVVDLAPCDQRLKVFIPLLEGADKDESDRARDRIRACNKEAGPPLLAAIAETKSLEQRGAIAEEAALLAPATAIPPLLEWLQKAERPDERQAFRKALAKGALREVGLRTLDATIAAETFAALPLITRIDVLRALGPEIGRTQHGAAAFGAVAKAAVDFRDRYLLLSVAADLARAGDAGALGVLTAALADDADPRLVARAASLSRGVTKLTPRLFALLDAKHVRVREAALLALTSPGAPVGAALGNKLLGRLTEDPWTFVRLAAAGALVAAPKDAALDAKIAAAVDLEPSPGVRAELSRTLGERDARSASQTLRERAFDRKEAIEVRVAALGALGQVCDKSASEELSAMALQGVRPTFESDRKLAVAAISALAVLRPASLKDTLTKLAAKDAPPELRAAAKRELERTAAPCK